MAFDKRIRNIKIVLLIIFYKSQNRYFVIDEIYLF